MINVFLSINNNEEVLQLPVPPKKYAVPSPWKNELVDGLQRSIVTIGMRELRTVEIESFFPAKGHDYPFLQSREYWGMEYVDMIERWRERRYPLRLIISDQSGEQSLNMAVTMDLFEWGTQQDGDIFFTMKMTEFALIELSGR
ncbi:hypothetical protein [Paenibacillus sp. 32O-W]|uniref:hypothetical protein n=1 Tax=Paenibacillus sp. 32O-W TaxID=1695218 RepID=UPI0021B50EC5|nr:hypothetical protein [Paenibacillus sp. 32O-W]